MQTLLQQQQVLSLLSEAVQSDVVHVQLRARDGGAAVELGEAHSQRLLQRLRGVFEIGTVARERSFVRYVGGTRTSRMQGRWGGLHSQHTGMMRADADTADPSARSRRAPSTAELNPRGAQCLLQKEKHAATIGGRVVSRRAVTTIEQGCRL